MVTKTYLHHTGLSFMLACGVVLVSMTESQSANPAPRARQLKIGAATYSSSVLWSNSALRRWFADRYYLAAGSGGNPVQHITEMKGYNPSLKALAYNLYVLPAQDTLQVKAWCATKGYNFNDLVLRVKNTSPADSVRCRAADIGSSGFARWVTTRPGGVLLGPGFTDAQTRFCWDFRNPKVGEYLGEMWRDEALAMNYDGVIVDEESIIGYTHNAPQGIYPPMAPFRDVTGSFWSAGSPYTSLTKNWTSAFDLEDGGSTHSYVDVRDSLRRARKGWMSAARAKLNQAGGLWYAPNFAATPVSSLANWNSEAMMVASLAGSFIMGEYSYFSPSAGSSEANCNTAVQACYSVKDSTVNLIVGWIRMGQYEFENGISYDRSKMNGLGMFLDCLFPGNASYIFFPSVKNGQVDYVMNRLVGSTVADDTTTMWANAWGKYFGIPQTTRDTTIKGTDPAGQGYTLHKVTLKHPTNSSQIQTIAVGRYARGANNDLSQSAVSVNLGGLFYELRANGTYAARVSSTTISNAQWRIFVADTTLANNGVTTGTADITPPGTIVNLSALTGSNLGEINVTWSAPAEDGTSGGPVAGYLMKIRDSLDGPITAANFTSSLTVTRTLPVTPPGSSQTVVLTVNDGLQPGRAYYVALKSYDDAGNYSAISNNAKATAKSQTIVPCNVPPTYCTGTTGNLNCNEDSYVDVTDLTILLSYLFIDNRRPCCFGEANIDGLGGPEPDIGDLTRLVQYLFYAPTDPLPPCPPGM